VRRDVAADNASHPTYVVDDVVHYCVTNMPGAVARTSTFALSNMTTSFVLALADKGWRRALSEDPHLLKGLNVHDGRITYRHRSQSHWARGTNISRNRPPWPRGLPLGMRTTATSQPPRHGTALKFEGSALIRANVE
jgi:hypothetical protein